MNMYRGIKQQEKKQNIFNKQKKKQNKYLWNHNNKSIGSLCYDDVVDVRKLFKSHERCFGRRGATLRARVTIYQLMASVIRLLMVVRWRRRKCQFSSDCHHVVGRPATTAARIFRMIVLISSHGWCPATITEADGRGIRSHFHGGDIR